MFRFGRPHHDGQFGRGVVEADQVQGAVNDVEQQLVGRRPAELARVANGRVGAGDNLAFQPSSVRSSRKLSTSVG